MNSRNQTLPFSLDHKIQRKRPETSNLQGLTLLAHLQFFRFENLEKIHKVDPIRFAQKTVMELTHKIGLSMTNAAEVLHVTRPTAYSWLNAIRGPQTTQMTRLLKLANIISYLKKENVTAYDLDFNATLPNGTSILSILANDHISESTLKSALNCLRTNNIVYELEIPEDDSKTDEEVPESLIKIFQSGRRRK